MRADSEEGSGVESQYVVVHELKPKTKKKSEIIDMLKELVEVGAREFSTFTVLDRGEQMDSETGEADEGLYVFLRCGSKEVLDQFAEEHRVFEGTWENIRNLCEWKRKTTWKACGIGFIGRK